MKPVWWCCCNCHRILTSLDWLSRKMVYLKYTNHCYRGTVSFRLMTAWKWPYCSYKEIDLLWVKLSTLMMTNLYETEKGGNYIVKFWKILYHHRINCNLYFVDLSCNSRLIDFSPYLGLHIKIPCRVKLLNSLISKGYIFPNPYPGFIMPNHGKPIHLVLSLLFTIYLNLMPWVL